MDKLLLHPKTSKQLDSILTKPPHALLIYGPAGSNKLKISLAISAELLNINSKKLSNHPYFILVTKPEGKQDIPIEAIRAVIKQLTLKPATSTEKIINRVVVIDSADKMSIEAQNALLKIIEEPPDKSLFILTAPSVNSILPTIASRAERLAISPIGLDDALLYFSGEHRQADIEPAWRLSGGAAGLTEQILKDNDAHPLKSAVDQAKQLLAADRYNRLLMLDTLSEDRARFSEILDALSRILTALHHAAINADNQRQTDKLLAARKLVDSAQNTLVNNTSARLLAINLAQQLPI